MSWLSANPARIIDAITFFSAILQAALQLGLSVTSWFRTPSHNAVVGKHPDSQHQIGTAADLVPDPGTDRAAVIAHFQHLGYTVIDEGDHLHVQKYSHTENPLAKELAHP